MDEWTEDVAVRAWVEWVLSLVPPDGWKERRRALERFEAEVLPRQNLPRPGTAELGRSRIPGDRAGWYVYQAQLYLTDPMRYEMSQGSRIIPVVQTVGAHLRILRAVPGADARMAGSLVKEGDSIDSTLFEMLVACAYATRGWDDVAFIDEDPSARSPDLVAHSSLGNLLVECKRKRAVSDYLRRERQHRIVLLRPLTDALRDLAIDWCLDICFHRPIVTYPEDFLRRSLVPLLRLGQPGILVDGAEMTVRAIRPDWDRLRDAMRRQDIRADTARIASLLYGVYEPWKALSGMIAGEPRPGAPHYMRDVSWASAILVSCDAPEDTRAKAAHFRRELADAVRQLPQGTACAVHIGAEAYEGEGVEAARYSRILNEMMGEFDYEGREVKCVYCNLFTFEVPPDENWAVEEKCHYFVRDDGLPWLLEARLLLAREDSH
jgi:hypothetical protein